MAQEGRYPPQWTIYTTREKRQEMFLSFRKTVQFYALQPLESAFTLMKDQDQRRRRHLLDGPPHKTDRELIVLKGRGALHGRDKRKR